MSGSSGDRSDYNTSVPIGTIRPGGGGSGGGGGAGGGGSGGGGGGGGGSSGGGDDDPCDIVQDAPINSPNPKVVPALSVGDVLDVVLTGSPPHQVLAVRTSAGANAGSLTHRGHLALVRCIQAGHQYRAEVIQRTGGAVVVRVERV